MLLESAEVLPFRVSSEISPCNEIFKMTQFLKRQKQAVLCFVRAVLISHVDIKSKGQAHFKMCSFSWAVKLNQI